MNFLRVSTDWQDPSMLPIEIVERKGVGHPDTLADALADRISVEYSKFCQGQFGYVLHHNLDKLYIGGGLFKQGYGYRKKQKPVRVVTHGRVSGSFGNKEIDFSSIAKGTIRSYLRTVMPHLYKDDVIVDVNSTQHTKIPYWFNPRGIQDLPEIDSLKSNDTSVCVAHWPLTLCEKLAYELEASFWENQNDFPVPVFDDLGQDIKVMVVRDANTINITACVPIICTKVRSERQYQERINEIRLFFKQRAEKISEGSNYSITTFVNPHKPYLSATGSCIDCGKEGLVGRGNSFNGVISAFRSHSVEASYGKNPMYHVGRVYGFLTHKIARLIHEKYGCPCSVIAMTQSGGKLIPPYLLSISSPVKIDKRKTKRLIEENLINSDYLSEILNTSQIR